jgi:arsenate reductase
MGLRTPDVPNPDSPGLGLWNSRSRSSWLWGFLGFLGIAGIAGFAVTAFAANERQPQGKTMPNTEVLYPSVAAYLAERQAEFDQITPERKAALAKLSAYIREHASGEKPARLIFVCTHNSRRSHLSQLWAAAAARAYGLPVITYSGGTESTAFNPRAVAAVERAGMQVHQTFQDSNPVYHVRFGETAPVQTCFSKRYDHAPNPKDGFAAVMVCGDADRRCPAVRGADARFAIPFVDPKVSDGTAREAATYDERCAQIAREMLYVMSSL